MVNVCVISTKYNPLKYWNMERFVFVLFFVLLASPCLITKSSNSPTMYGDVLDSMTLIDRADFVWSTLKIYYILLLSFKFLKCFHSYNLYFSSKTKPAAISVEKYSRVVFFLSPNCADIFNLHINQLCIFQIFIVFIYSIYCIFQAGNFSITK